jgi:hypothetical protein
MELKELFERGNKVYYVDRRFKELSHMDNKTSDEENEFLMLNNNPGRYIKAVAVPSQQAYAFITEDQFGENDPEVFLLNRYTFEVLFEKA